jgi:ankyrin repeat protein
MNRMIKEVMRALRALTVVATGTTTGFLLPLTEARAAMTETGTALLTAAANGDWEGVRALITPGGALDAQDAQGRTALLMAVDRNQIEIARALISAGASVNVQAANKDTPWLLAGAQGRTEVIQAMLGAKPDLSIRNRYGGNALIPACERAHVKAIKLLLTSGIDVDHVNNLGWTCLLEIVILGDGGPRHQEAARLILTAKADPNLADRDGVTPLTHARARGQKEVAALIEAAGGRP